MPPLPPSPPRPTPPASAVTTTPPPPLLPPLFALFLSSFKNPKFDWIYDSEKSAECHDR